MALVGMETCPALDLLEPLPDGHYVTAFGPGHRCLFGTPSGYGGKFIPTEIAERIASGDIKRVNYASFGANVNEWFIEYAHRDGGITYGHGPDTPQSLYNFAATRTTPFFRVQFGASGSFVAWTDNSWMIQRIIPDDLRRCLEQIDMEGSTGRPDRPTNISWHNDGSFVMTGVQPPKQPVTARPWYPMWKLFGSVQRDWSRLWGFGTSDERADCSMGPLVHAAINPHRDMCDSYVFIKAPTGADGIDYVVRIGTEESVLHLQPPIKTVAPDEYRGKRWVRSLRNGRPHKTDAWELLLKKNEDVRILRDQGRGWFLAQDRRGMVGYVYEDWVDLKGAGKPYIPPAVALARFKSDSEQLSSSTSATEFPDLSYMDHCTDEQCKRVKEDENGIGICVHDLGRVLSLEGKGSATFLKTERNKWHPDRFHRICQGRQGTELVKKAQALFVLVNELLEELEEQG
ncbi:hypothetical protein M011DRAFT_481754 [Sporormia fimetaria CBS 119925]|uniref:SH3 domain-containing protein n=1 Tax=Sporormia fimetaria CBS 119925 TaxID=1340428 RepID=A0A6A6UY09_9PLEO|nr:hypothetical protein M011DRAFT_481754 [Sporormia fimetaria CBS 119925]